LLDLTFGGQVFRFATEAAEVTTDDGRTFRYDVGLSDFDFDFSDAALDLSVGVTIESGVDWAELAAQGTQLERAPATLRRWFVGQVLERARVVVRGITSDPEYGAVDDPFELSVMSAPIEQSDTLPRTQHTVSASTWPVTLLGFDEKLEGAQYPIVIGYPGTLGDGVGAPAVPALMVDFDVTDRNSDVLVAGHPVDAIRVSLHDLTDNPAVGVRPIAAGADLLGQACSLVNFVGGGAFVQSADRSWYSGFDIDNGGGLLRDGAALRGAGEVLRYFFEKHTRIQIDRGRWLSQEPRLNRYKVDAWINSSTNVYDWMQAVIMPFLPVLPVQTSSGLYYRHLDWKAPSYKASRRLDADRGQIERQSGFRSLGDPIYNEIAVEYAPYATSSRFRKRVVVTAQAGATTLDPASVDDARIVENYRCKVSQGLFGVKPQTFQFPAIWDDATATLVARDLANRFALPHRRISYTGGAALESLTIGDLILLNDSELYISDAPALVFEVNAGGGPGVGIDLVLIDSPEGTQRITT
jgi:hypothetical protein